MSLPDWVQPGAKAYVKLNGQQLPALVLETAFSSEGDYLQTRLRIAMKNHLTGDWIISNYPKPIQSYKLKKRESTLPELDTTLPEPAESDAVGSEKPEPEGWPYYPAPGTGRVPEYEELETWLRYWSRLRGYPRLQYIRGDGKVIIVEQGEIAWSQWFEHADYDDLHRCFMVANVYDCYDHSNLPRPWANEAAAVSSGEQQQVDELARLRSELLLIGRDMGYECLTLPAFDVNDSLVIRPGSEAWMKKVMAMTDCEKLKTVIYRAKKYLRLLREARLVPPEQPEPTESNADNGDQTTEFRHLKESGQHLQDASEDQARERHFRED